MLNIFDVLFIMAMVLIGIGIAILLFTWPSDRDMPWDDFELRHKEKSQNSSN